MRFHIMHCGAPSQVRQVLVAENQAHCPLNTHKQSSQEVCTAWQDTEKYFESVLTCSLFIKTIFFHICRKFVGNFLLAAHRSFDSSRTEGINPSSIVRCKQGRTWVALLFDVCLW